MSKVDKKVERYIKLSQKFQKPAEDIFGKEPINHGLITINGGSSSPYLIAVDTFGNMGVKEQPKPKTRAEKILEKAETEAKLAEEYDEYLTLQTELGNYFKALNKIEQ